MIRVRAASRLHFGLFSLPPEGSSAYWPNSLGEAVLPARRFGGAGLMVEAPGLELRAEPAAAWCAEGPLAERALRFAREFAQTLAAPTPQRIVIERAPPEHAGLGSGTQLGLAVARAVAAAHRLDLDAVELARRVGRGKRSGLGVHGFERGGFLVEAGKRGSEGVAPLAVRLPFPEEWRVVLVLPAWGQGLHGATEVAALQRLLAEGWPLERTDSLCRLALLGMVPALIERDLAGFGVALYDLNRRVGEAFRAVQGGTYAHPRTAEVVAFVRQQGIAGVGQSSWGPAVFAVVGDGERAAALVQRLRERFRLVDGEVLATAAANRGTVVS
jgi:beta-RFAP synthase